MKTNFVFKKMAALTMLSASVISLAPAQSHALLGALTGNIPLIVIGVGTMLGAATVGGVNNEEDGPDGLSIASLAAFMAGVVVLDDHNQVSPKFTELDAQSAATLNIDPVDEMTAYNRELPAINSIYQTIIADAQKYNQSGTTAKELLEYAAKKWSEYGQSLSPSAQSALTKVRTSFNDRMHAKGA